MTTQWKKGIIGAMTSSASNCNGGSHRKSTATVTGAGLTKRTNRGRLWHSRESIKVGTWDKNPPVIVIEFAGAAVNASKRRAEKFGKRRNRVDPTGGPGREKGKLGSQRPPHYWSGDEVQLLALASLDANYERPRHRRAHRRYLAGLQNDRRAESPGYRRRSDRVSLSAARRRYSTQIGASQKSAAGDSAGRNYNTFATCSTLHDGWCRTPARSKSAARSGILTNASRVAKFCRGLQRERASRGRHRKRREPNE